MVRTVDVDELVDRARQGQPRAVARLISLVEDASPKLRDVAKALAPMTGRARVIGLTGPPGVGKSTSTSLLVTAFRERGARVRSRRTTPPASRRRASRTRASGGVLRESGGGTTATGGATGTVGMRNDLGG